MHCIPEKPKGKGAALRQEANKQMDKAVVLCGHSPRQASFRAGGAHDGGRSDGRRHGDSKQCESVRWRR